MIQKLFTLLALNLLCAGWGAYAQQDDVTLGRGPFTHADTLRGGQHRYRTAYDARFYDLHLNINPADSSLRGYNVLHLEALTTVDSIQIDLFSHWRISRIVQGDDTLRYHRDGNAIFVRLTKRVNKGDAFRISVFYEGRPVVAPRPPWDGGFVWRTDSQGKPWVGVACEGFGASSWWPLKDDLRDEPDSMRMTYTVPPGLQAIGNGSLRSMVTHENGWSSFEWFVHYSINSYNVTLNVADYAHFSDVYEGTAGPLQLDYYVLRANEARARKHFAQVKPMLAIFEKHFGPYPFPKDGYALVETSYWGMEHQGAIAYGNNYQNMPWGWDYIIVHETGHEWFGNSISVGDHADMWVHESFTTYMEAVYMEERWGKAKAIAYLQAQKQMIQNVAAILGPRGVNFNDWPDADMYYKGSWMLHTLRHVVGNDSLWWAALRGLCTEFHHHIVTSDQVIAYLSRQLGADYTSFFATYLRYRQPPTISYSLRKKGKGMLLTYKWQDGAPGFAMPTAVIVGGQSIRLPATQQSQTLQLPITAPTQLRWDTDHYYHYVRELPKMK